MNKALLCMSLILAGCATPDAPGQGAGATYTPVVDMQGVNPSQYAADLAACRQYAVAMDNPSDNMRAVIGGQVFSAALMAALGGSSRQVGQAANYGGLAAINRHSGRVMTRQESVLGNCLASRGYRVLDGTAQVTYTQAVGAPMQPAAAPPTAYAGNPTAMAPPAAYAPSPGIVTLPTGAGNPAPPAEASGKDAYVAERLARDLKCNATALSKLVGKGPGYESYSMACTNGETLLIRCEFGNCRALK